MKKEKITAKHIKLSLLQYLRYNRQYIVGTEVNNADILAIGETHSIEVEIKISISDLKADKKKHKHHAFKRNLSEWEKNFYPNKFMYCVLPGMEKETYQLIKEINPAYGFMVYNHEERNSQYAKFGININRSAKYIHRHYSNEIKTNIMKRISSELITFYKKGWYIPNSDMAEEKTIEKEPVIEPDENDMELKRDIIQDIIDEQNTNINNAVKTLE